jgi:hypothetical protein
MVKSANNPLIKDSLPLNVPPDSKTWDKLGEVVQLQEDDLLCPLCHSEIETMEHLFLDYHFVRVL